MKEYRYVIGLIPPSLNKFAGRGNVWDYRKEKQEWKRIVMLCCNPKPEKPLKRVEVELCYFFKTAHRHDPDNYAGKMILDGLVDCGILEDDSFKHIDLLIKGRVDKENPRTEVIIRDLEAFG